MIRYTEKFRHWKYFDLTLFFAVLALCFIGLAAIYATGQTEYFGRQLFSLGLGMLFFLLFCIIDYRAYKKFTEILYAVSILMLIIVLNVGTEMYGAQRWIGFYGWSIQPSEIAKIALIMSLAKFFEMRQSKLNSIIEIIPSFILVGIPFFMIYKQPDLGSAIIFVFIFSAMSLWAGMKFSRLLLLASPLLSILVLFAIPLYPLVTWVIYLVGIFIFLLAERIQFLDSAIYLGLNICSGIFSPFLWNSLSAYQKTRILSFLNPDLDPLARGVRYHTVKSVIAVGSGGFLGRGFLQGPLTNLQYIPQQHTDFIFSVIGEEFGLLGCLLVLGLLVFILFRLLTIARQTGSIFGRLLVIGIAGMIMFQAFVNIGMNIGLVPVVGLPLPFISYGGTSLVVCLTAIGMVQSINMRKRDLIF